MAGRNWGCTWLSFAEVDSSGYTAEVSLPGSGWATFDFPSAGNNSDVNYKRNTWLEKLFQGASLVGVRMHEENGSYLEYGNLSDQGTYKLFYITGWYDPQGQSVTFGYTSGLLTSVTFADSTAFQLYYNDSNDSTLITSVTNTSMTLVATLTHGETGPGSPDNYAWTQNLTTIQDAVGIANNVWYPYPGYQVGSIVTPYGTTRFSYNEGGVFDYSTRITQADSSQEFYGVIMSYAGGDWPDFSSNQIPAGAPIGTLDTNSMERVERNTFYWNAQQFSGLAGKDLSLFNWDDFKKGRIRHWLATVDPTYSHYDTLSVEQAPSPDSDGSTEGALVWYDYPGKPNGMNGERGTQIMPSVIARVMPDSSGTTWYQYFERNSIGRATNTIEKWVAGGTTYYRTNKFNYSSDGVDLLTWHGPSNELISGRSYNSYHEVLTATNAVGDVTTYTYETSAPYRLKTVLTAGGLLSTNTYDGGGHLQNVVDSIGGTPLRTNSYTWLNGDLRTHTDPRSLTVTNTYDALHRLTRVDYPGCYTQNVYTNGAGVMLLDWTAARDRLGNWTYYGYDALRRIIALTNANNVVTRFGYCDCGSTSYITNAFGVSGLAEVTQFYYDNQGNRTNIYYPDNSVTNTYDALGRLTILRDALGNVTNSWDNLNRLVAVSNYFGQIQATTFDVEDRAIYATDANGVTVTNTYDKLGRLLTQTYPDAGSEKFGYSALGLVKYTNQLGFVTSYGYDAAMRKSAETNANSEVIKYTYNAASDLLSLVDGKSQTNKWNYDLYGRVTNKLDQANVEILRYQYDADSRLTNRWSKAMGNTAYLYDAVGNLTKVDYPSGTTDITLAYDALNRMTNMVDAAGTSKYTYYAGGLLATEDGPWASDTVTYTYNNRLRASLSLQQPTGSWTNGYTWDAAHRLSTEISPAGTFTYTYKVGQASSLPIKLSLPNSSYITNIYDNVARLTGTYLDNSSNTILDKSEYLYNTNSQRIRLTRTDGSYYTNNYDNIGQLVWADSTVASEDRGYLYDAAWNLNNLTNSAGTTSFSVNSKNELTNIASYYSLSCTYDDNGNMSTRGYDYIGPKTYNYAYDAENQLTAMATDSSNTPTSSRWKTEFTYDGRGRLRKRIDYTWLDPYGWYGGVETRYVHDGMRVIQERDGSNNPLVAYTRGSDLSGSFEGAGGIGGLLARSHGYSSGSLTNHNFYHADGNGNISYMVNSSQSMVATYRYDPFGNYISQSGTLASANVYRFSSKERHANSGMYYYGYRWYDPNLQRWLKRDPIGEEGGINLYGFVFNDPSDQIDTDGRRVLSIPKVLPRILPRIAPALEIISCPECEVAMAGFGVGWALGHYTGLHEGLGNWLAGPDPDSSPLPLPEPHKWKPIDPGRAKAEQDCLDRVSGMDKACRDRGSAPLTREEKKKIYDDCMEEKGYPVKR